METGTGKTKAALMRALALRSYKLINQLLVIAPNGVHKDWVREALPLHWPQTEFPFEAAYHAASNKAAERRAVQRLFEPALPGFEPFRILTANIECILHRKHYDLLATFLRAGATLMVLDESDLIKTPGIRTTRCACRLGELAAFRLIMTGTDVSEGPFDYYAQFQFLRKGLLGHENFATFKARYAEWDKKVITKGDGSLHEFPVVKAYQNLDELRANVNAHSFRCRKADCTDLPPQLHRVRTVELAPEQRRAYNLIRERVLVELRDGTVTSAHAFTRMLRLQQVTGGYVQYDDTKLPLRIPGPNAKLDALLQEVNTAPHDTGIIIWARFIPELDAIYAALSTHFGGRGRVARYWGAVPPELRDEEAQQFKIGGRRFMVAQQHAGGRGHTWLQGRLVFYFSNDFSYVARKQSEDRSHRIGQTEAVTYIDLAAEDTLDKKILGALQAKRSVAEFFADPLELLKN